MFNDDLPLNMPKPIAVPRKLDGLSHGELDEYEELLSTELERVKEYRREKGGIHQAAEALFKR